MKIREIEKEIIALHAQADACLASAGDMLNRASALREKANKLRDELNASIVEERTRHNKKKKEGYKFDRKIRRRKGMFLWTKKS